MSTLLSLPQNERLKNIYQSELTSLCLGTLSAKRLAWCSFMGNMISIIDIDIKQEFA